MSEGTLGILILLGVVILSALAAHAYTNKFWIANGVAALAGTIVVHVVAFLNRGYFDPFEVISIPFAFLVGLGIAAFVGHAIRTVRRSRDRERDSEAG